MKKYSGFTLIEMLIVMGIIIILMAAGVAGGRFAIQRANRIQKQNAVGNIEQALWGFYTDQRNFPPAQSPNTLLSNNHTSDTPHGVKEYLDAGQWDGGSEASFYYFVSSDRQTFVVCATLGGINDVQGVGNRNYGIYCSGNGLQQISPFAEAPVMPSDNIFNDVDHSVSRNAILVHTGVANWSDGSW